MWDLSLPGYKYLGPGNKLDKGKPTNYNDLVAYIHDIGYGTIIEKGGNPYLLWSEADAEAYNAFTLHDYGGAAGKAFFGLKKLAHQAGLIDSFENLQKNKQAMGKSNKQRDYIGNTYVGADKSRQSRFNKLADEQAAARKNKVQRLRTGDDEMKEVEMNIEGDSLQDAVDNLPSVPEETPQDTPVEGPAERSNMTEPGGDEPMEAQAVARAGGTMAGSVSKETPITMAQPSYGLQETHTAVLPWSGWISVGGLDKNTPAQLKIRMNAPWDMIDVTTQTTPADGAQVTTKGFYGPQIDCLGRYSNTLTSPFPEAFGSAATTAHERPAWREFWTKLYDYYTVLGCEYEIIMYNPQVIQTSEQALIANFNSSNTLTASGQGGFPQCSPFNTDVVCAVQYDTYSDTATSTGNVMPITKYSETRAFKNIQWYPIQGGKKNVIRGTYRPGQAKRNIINDGDVKTWTATTSTLPNLKEILTLNFWNDPFFNARLPDAYLTTSGISSTGGGRYGCVNMEINLKYIVQFKDLKQQARYPNSVTTDQDITLTLNETIGTAGSALQSWTTASV